MTESSRTARHGWEIVSKVRNELQLLCRRGQELLTKNITLNIYSSITPPSADEDHMMWSQNSYEMDIVERPFPQPHQHHLTDAIKCCATLSLSFRQLVRSEYCTSHQMQIHSFVTLLSRCVCVCVSVHMQFWSTRLTCEIMQGHLSQILLLQREGFASTDCRKLEEW